MAVLIILLGGLALWINTLLTEYLHYYNPTIEDLMYLYDTTSSGQKDMNWVDLNIPETSYAEIIDKEYTVLHATANGHEVGYQYSVRVFNEQISDLDSDMMIFYPYEDDREMLVLFMPLRDVIIPYQATLVAMILFIIGSFTTVNIISRFSAKQIIHPIERLSLGVHKIRGGEYGSTIQLETGNDLDRLADDINQLSLAINNEISLREDLEKSRQQLILDISHDLKTPLTNIIGYSESLSTSEHLSDSDKSFLGAIQRNGQRANCLLNDLFTYSKLNAVAYHLDLHPYDLRYVLEEFIAGCIPDIEAADKSYLVLMDDVYNQHSDGLFQVQLDLQNFRRILHNLVDNFIHHSGPHTEITFSLSHLDQGAQIDISDNGVGISPEQAKQIFNPFYRSDASRSSSTGGSGLGLSITQKIIQLHRGTIELQASDHGTHFKITLPTIQ